MAEDKGVVALPLGAERVVDRLDGAAELGEPAEIPVGRRHADHVDADARSRDLVEIGSRRSR